MFGLFKSKLIAPLDYERRKYFENNLLWLEYEFPLPPLNEREILTPAIFDSTLKWGYTEGAVRKATEFVAERMQIPYSKIKLNFFDNGISHIDMGSTVIFMQNDPETSAAGLYHHNIVDNYEISIAKEGISKPNAIIATIAHELAHIKLLAEKGLEENDEYLTDLATVFFGFGVFGANAAFEFEKTHEKWGYRQLGYIMQEEWAYALALIAFMRREPEPQWSNYLNTSVKKDFERSLKYMVENEQEIFRIEAN